jgi:hypothetical protein
LTTLDHSLHLELRWSEDKPVLGIVNCGMSFHALSGGRIMCINHMTSLLVDHPQGFTWENYGEAWETDHIWPYAELDWRKKWHRFKLHNYLNLQPLTPKENADKNYHWQLSRQAVKKVKRIMSKQKRGRLSS